MADTSESAVVVTLQDGTTLKRWDSYTFASDFLDAADAWTVTFGGDDAWLLVKDKALPDTTCSVTVDGALQCTGWLDSAEVVVDETSTRVTLSGRDVLKPMVDANIHPDTAVKNVTIEQLVELVLGQVYLSQQPTLFTDNEANRLVLSATTTAKGKAASSQALTKRIEWAKPQVGESAFEFVSRNLRRFGLWMWATADGGVVISSPTYDQPPSYKIRRMYGDKIIQVKSATWRRDKTSVPSIVIVRGKSAAKDFEKTTVRGSMKDPDAALWKPMYVVHDNATTNDEAANFARQEMSMKLQGAETYECTLVGHTDPRTGAVYAIDTLAQITDEVCGLEKVMYVAGRTFERTSAGSTTTRLRCVPVGSIQFSDVDAP